MQKLKYHKEERNGRCPAGQYYCYTNKECKPIPAGFMVDPAGMLRKENGASISEEGLRDWFGKSKSKDGKPGWVNVVTGGTCASDEPGEGTPKCVSSAKRASMTKAERLSAARRKKAADPGQQAKTGAAKPTYVKTDVKEEWSDKYKKSIDCDNPKGFSQKAHCQGRKKKMNEEADKKGKSSGKKDACYHKVKSRYSVWPSAYASGALVKCRKKGAANWGNKSEQFSGIVAEILNELELDEKCWDGYKQVGMKKKGKKIVPNCVPVSEEDECTHTEDGKNCPIHGKEKCPSVVDEAVKLNPSFGNIISVIISWRGKNYMNKMFFPQIKLPTRRDVIDQIQKVYPGASVLSYSVSELEPGQPLIQVTEETIEEVAAWQRSAGKNKSGGLNEKGRKSYERENPGSDLKAPSKKVGNPRRASFCARMKGMKAKLTSAKTARDPDSRINKSLRAWNC